MKWIIKAEIFNPVKNKIEIIDAFTWNGTEESGIQRAKDEAANFNVDIRRVWAEKI